MTLLTGLGRKWGNGNYAFLYYPLIKKTGEYEKKRLPNRYVLLTEYYNLFLIYQFVRAMYQWTSKYARQA